MIHKHEIPILEFDDNPQAVIMPTHEGLDCTYPKNVFMLSWRMRLIALPKLLEPNQ